MSVDNVIALSKSISLNHKEIVLAGIHTGRYFEDGYDLAKLIKKMLDENKDIERIRISSIEITEISDDLIELMKNDKRIAKHFHVPLQSGSDEILKLMRRPYDTKLFFDRINYIKQEIPGVSISTDLIVGFPKESDELFNETLSFLEKCEFSFIHVFPFSSKVGTVAYSMSDMVPNIKKKDRVNKISELSKKLYYTYKGSFIQKDLEVLVERVEGEYSFGHSSEYIPVYVEGNFNRNEMIKVKGSYINDDTFYAVKE